MKPFSPDAGIPVLTEVIAAAPRPVASSDQPLAPDVDCPLDPNAVPASPLSRDEFNRVADLVLERILTQLQTRFDALLGDRLEDHLSDRLHTIAANLAMEIRHDVRQELEAIIAATRAKNSNDPDFTNG